ncbi:hypothetical protein [Aestuariivirga sp.]|uniref:hypothetical protein n=1 Tax=Aestuariivirga sp. TaxID=2650926 RepID=UPI0039E2A8F4
MNGWIGVDLDGTLAHYDTWRGIEHIGEPIPKMMARVRQWVAEGKRVKIMTARVAGAEGESAKLYIRRWLNNYGLFTVDITNVKDFEMIELWDDRAVSVQKNTGDHVRYINEH